MLTPEDIKFFQSELEGSAGGGMSTLEIPKDKLSLIFPDVTLIQKANGGVDYRKIFILNINQNDDLINAFLWLLMQPSAGIEMGIGIGTAGDTNGSVISYVSPTSMADGLSLGNLAPSSLTPIWIRRVVPIATPEFERGFFQLALSGSVS